MIRFFCPRCATRYEVDDAQGGQLTECVNCHEQFRIPSYFDIEGWDGDHSTQIPTAKPAADSEVIPPPLPASEETSRASWRLHAANGQEFGPVSKQELDSWVMDGSVQADDQVFCDGWTEWRRAGDVFPVLNRIARKPKRAIVNPWTYAIVGVALGCLIGLVAAHHFAFFGGFALIGRPYSPARWSLVPGHMLLCSIILGALGFLIAYLRNQSSA